MPSKLLCDPYFWQSPTIFLNTPIFPTDYTQCVSDRLNQIVLVFVLFMAVGYVATWKLQTNIPIILAILLALLVSGQSILIFLSIITRRAEGFQNRPSLYSKSSDPLMPDIPNVGAIGKDNEGIASLPIECVGNSNKAFECSPKATQPTAANPFMNVLIDELKYNPNRPAAKSVLDPLVQTTLSDFYKTEFYADPTDVFGKNQGQRQWITMPSTSIPNDIDSYQNWLYRIPFKTCKEGNPAACLPGTDGGPIPWLNDSTYTFEGSSATGPGSSPRDIAAAKRIASLKSAMVNRYPSPYVGSDSGLDDAAEKLKAERE
jgi:hypothetical protein